MTYKLLKKFYEEHKDTPHRSRYHAESFYDHCMLVIYYALCCGRSDVVKAAMLHDVLKPATQGINKRGEPCFYGHENITPKDMEAYDMYDPYVYGLVRCHMMPYYTEDWRNNDLVGYYVDDYGDMFLRDLEALHECDMRGTVRPGDTRSPEELQSMIRTVEEFLREGIEAESRYLDQTWDSERYLHFYDSWRVCCRCPGSEEGCAVCGRWYPYANPNRYPEYNMAVYAAMLAPDIY